jgi:hypothetical protein
LFAEHANDVTECEMDPFEIQAKARLAAGLIMTRRC